MGVLVTSTLAFGILVFLETPVRWWPRIDTMAHTGPWVKAAQLHFAQFVILAEALATQPGVSHRQTQRKSKLNKRIVEGP